MSKFQLAYLEFSAECKRLGWVNGFPDGFKSYLSSDLKVKIDDLPDLVACAWNIWPEEDSWAIKPFQSLGNTNNIYSLLRYYYPKITLFQFLCFMEEYSGKINRYPDVDETYRLVYIKLRDIYDYLSKYQPEQE